MVDNSTNINKANNSLPPQITKHNLIFKNAIQTSFVLFFQIENGTGKP